MNPFFQYKKLCEIAKRVKRKIELVPTETYRTLGCKLYGEGVYQREEKKGIEILAKNMYLVKENDLVFNRIWAQKGSVGIVPQEISGSIVTSDFPVYEFDMNQIYPKYIGWYVKTIDFWEECKQHSYGTSGRQRLSPKELPNIKFPIYDFKIQKKIVAFIENKVNIIKKIEYNKQIIENEVETLWNNSVIKAFKGNKYEKKFDSAHSILDEQSKVYSKHDLSRYNNAHPWKPHIYEKGLYSIPDNWIWTDVGSTLTHIVDCVNDTPFFSEYPTDYLGLKSTNIRPFFLDLSKKWYVSKDDYLYWNRRETPMEGDLILTREAPMGNSCILPADLNVCLTQRLLLMRNNEKFVSNRYLLHYLNSSIFYDQVIEHSRGLTTPHLRVKDLPKILIPLCPKPHQESIVKQLDNLFDSVQKIRSHNSEIKNMLDKLIPSILNEGVFHEFMK